MANRVFRVKLKPELAKQVKNAEPIEVIVRLYGTEMLKNLDAPKMLGDAGEILVFYIASQNNLGPKLIGVHDKCRIEEYIENQRPSREELEKFEIDAVIAKKFAQIHSLEMPIIKENLHFYTIFYVWMKANVENNQTEMYDLGYDEKETRYADEIDQFKLFEEVQWIENMGKKIKAKQVFCHNDLHLYNILFKTDQSLNLDQKMIPIDMELSSYNWRGYDLAYYFNFRYYHIFEGKTDFDKVRYPDEEMKRNFIEIYLNHLQQFDPNFDSEVDNLPQVVKEVHLMSLICHLFLFGFFINLRKNPEMQAFFQQSFDFGDEKEEYYFGIDYAYHRFQKYLTVKKSFIEKYCA